MSSVPTYRIKDWKENFETHETRKLKTLSWVAMPTKLDGKSYRRLMRMNPMHYLAWTLIVKVASKCPERGVLADEDGPLTADDLSVKTDAPVEVFEAAFEPLCQVGWLERDCEKRENLPASPDVPGDSPGIAGDSPGIRRNPPDTVQDITVQNKRTTSADADEFELWYSGYPRKVSRGEAERAFKTARKIADLQTLVAGLRRYAESVAGQEAKYIKHPATWLNGKCWLDETPRDPNAVKYIGFEADHEELFKDVPECYKRQQSTGS